MTLALWCILAAALLPYLFSSAAKWSSRYDNAAPRAYLDKLEGWRQRAHWAQLNSYEAFPPFAAAVLAAHLTRGANGTADVLAAAFILLRLAYGLCYVSGKSTLRSLVWVAATACTIALFFVAAGG